MAASVSLSIKDVPSEMAAALRERAAQNHRSLQGELMAILEDAVRPSRTRGFDVDRLVRQAKALGLKTEADAVRIIRELRDSR